jgi:lipopolysaccharide export system protein LptC
VTFRRIMLVVLPLLGATFVFMVLRYVYIDWESSLVRRQTIPGQETLTVPVGRVEMPTSKGALHEKSTNVNLVRKDKQGRLEMLFRADSLDHPEANKTDIERPQLQFFTRNNEIITLMADRGTMTSKAGLANIADIETGILTGHVVIVHDRGTPDDHSDDIYISVEDLKFNNETYELSTDGPVILVGLEMSLSARRMRLTLDRHTRRINTMTFMEDIFASLEAGDKLVSVMGPPQEGKPAAAPAAKGPSAAGAAAPPAEAERGEFWRIDLAGDVDAQQAAQRLTCDHFVFYNASGGGQKAPPAETGKKPDAAKKTLAEEPETRPEGWARNHAKFLQPDAPPPLVVVADGPLIITPVDAAERKAHAEEMGLAVAIGNPVTVDDAQTHIVGSDVRYNRNTGWGSVVGKGALMLLEQPGRLRLTGDRLDFDRRQLTAEVQGEGQLRALVQAASLSGSQKSKTPAPGAAPEPPSTLEASWTRGMRLDFYRLPTEDRSGMGEIRRAAFHGGALLKQQDGTLKGDDLTIDFFKPEAGRGQAVERLVGHGDVFLKNQPPEGQPPPADGSKPSSKLAIGDITCQDLDIAFIRDAAGSTQPKELKANGAKASRKAEERLVVINDPQGKIQAQDLTVTFGTNEKGNREAQFLDAIGEVNIQREDLNAEGDHVRRNLEDGTILLEGRPARAKRGQTRIVGPRIDFSQADGRAVVRGAGELEMPASTDLRGRPRAKAEPMLVRWRNGMLFEDKRNFAQFDGAVRAFTGGSRLASERLWIYFADRPDKPADTKPRATVAVVPAMATAAAPAGKEKAKPDAGGMQDLFGRKSLIRVLAEKDVHAVDQQLADDKTLRYQMEMDGDNLTYLEENRKAYIRGPGRLKILSREKERAGASATPGLAPAAVDAVWQGGVPEGYARTDATWADSMAYDGGTDRAYFKGNVEVVHTGRGAPGATSSRRLPGGTRIKSDDLQVVFAEKKPAEPGAAAPAQVSAEPPREERMSVEKLIADGGVHLWVNDRQGTAERLIYQREPELLRLYRGAEDWARLWRENEATQEYESIVARTITYEPTSGRVDVVDQQEMTVTPKPKPAAKTAPKARPAARP